MPCCLPRLPPSAHTPPLPASPAAPHPHPHPHPRVQPPPGFSTSYYVDGCIPGVPNCMRATLIKMLKAAIAAAPSKTVYFTGGHSLVGHTND